MCFSATASFVVSAGTAIAGGMAFARSPSRRELPLAAIPLVFAVQQAVEGVLWLTLTGGNNPAMVALFGNLFAFFAIGVWPVLTPVAVLLVERGGVRRDIMRALLVAGAALSAYGMATITVHPFSVEIAHQSLSYFNGHPYSPALLMAYVACTCGALMASSNRALLWFGILVATGLAVSTYFYFAVSFSVWCFFAAAGSVVIYLHFVTAGERVLSRRAA